MSLSIISRSESPKHIWYQDGVRRSIGGKQTVLADQLTRSRVILSPEGYQRFTQEDDPLKALLNRWAGLKANTAKSLVDTARDIGAQILKSSREGKNGWTTKYATVFRTIEEQGFIVKAYDYKRRLAPIQFDGMSFIANRLNQIDLSPLVRAPVQYGLIQTPGSSPAVFMQEVPGERTPGLDPYNLKRTTSERLGVFGRLLLNDFDNHNIILDTSPEGISTYYVIDQPHVSEIRRGNPVVSIGNFVAKLNPTTGG